jgi:hypothetical protein
MGHQPVRGTAALIGSLLLAMPGAASADGLALRFASSCAARERAELLRSPVGPWIIELCAREARARAAAYRRAEEPERRAMLVEECAGWHARNTWRLPPGLQADAAARRNYIDAACAAESEERRRQLDPLR